MKTHPALDRLNGPWSEAQAQPHTRSKTTEARYKLKDPEVRAWGDPTRRTTDKVGRWITGLRHETVMRHKTLGMR